MDKCDSQLGRYVRRDNIQFLSLVTDHRIGTPGDKGNEKSIADIDKYLIDHEKHLWRLEKAIVAVDDKRFADVLWAGDQFRIVKSKLDLLSKERGK